MMWFNPLRALRRLAADRRGMSAVEFALISPVFCLILVATVDIGGALMTKYRLDAAVAAGLNYAQVNGPALSASTAPTLGTAIANLIYTGEGTAGADVAVVVNDGARVTVVAGAVSNGGTAANAERCYCPTGGAGATTWGPPVACGSVCPGIDKGYGGKFVTILASQTYTPLLSTFGIVRNPISAAGTAQVQ